MAGFGQFLDEKLDQFHWLVDQRLELVNTQKTVHAEHDFAVEWVQSDTAVLQYAVDPD